MADTGLLEHDDEREGGVVVLTGPDGVSKRVWLGPRRHVHESGIVGVYTEDQGVGWLVAGARRAGYVQLKAAPERSDTPAETALLDGGSEGDGRGTLTLSNLSDPDAVAFLGYEPAGGPVLMLSNGETSVILSTRGLQVLPTKEGFDLNFVAPLAGSPGQAIHYCVVEGPEVGVQVRGSATLAAGRATVALPEHFAHVASDAELTVQLTPRSSKSRGVAVTSVTPREIVIEELGGGTGDYRVDWLVQGIRKGRESYQVVRPWRAPVAPSRPRKSEGEE
jgi:hypothetical protein